MIQLHLRYETLRTLLDLVSSMMHTAATEAQRKALRRVYLRISTDLNSSLNWIWLTLRVEDAGALASEFWAVDMTSFGRYPGFNRLFDLIPKAITPGPEDPTPFDPDTDLP